MGRMDQTPAPTTPEPTPAPFEPLVVDEDQRRRMMTGRVDRVGE